MKKPAFLSGLNSFRIFAMCICFTLILSTVAFGGVNSLKLVSSKVSANDGMLQKQREIDKLIFEKYEKDISKKGFKVTHTAPFDAYVEVGITPYNQANADYLYKLLGRDSLKVVEGQAITTLSTSNSLENKNTNALGVFNPIHYVLGGALLLIVSAFILYKLKLQR